MFCFGIISLCEKHQQTLRRPTKTLSAGVNAREQIQKLQGVGSFLDEGNTKRMSGDRPENKMAGCTRWPKKVSHYKFFKKSY